MSKWLKGAIKSGRKYPSYLDKPCHLLGWCPYGQLVEEFPLLEAEKEYATYKGWVTPDGYPDINRVLMDRNFITPEYRCGIFDHECPSYYLAENMAEKVEDDPDEEDFENVDEFGDDDDLSRLP